MGRAYNESIMGDSCGGGGAVEEFSFCQKGVEAGEGEGGKVWWERNGS